MINNKPNRKFFRVGCALLRTPGRAAALPPPTAGFAGAQTINN